MKRAAGVERGGRHLRGLVRARAGVGEGIGRRFIPFLHAGLVATPVSVPLAAVTSGAAVDAHATGPGRGGGQPRGCQAGRGRARRVFLSHACTGDINTDRRVNNRGPRPGSSTRLQTMQQQKRERKEYKPMADMGC